MKKRTALIFLALILAVSLSSARQTVLSEANELRIDLLRYDPSPVEPGKSSDVWFEITNLEDEDWFNFEITLTDGTPKLLDSDVKKLNFGNLKAGEKITFRFTVTPNKDIIDGDYKLNLGYKSGESKAYMSEPFTIKVKRVNRDVLATDTKVTAIAEQEIGMLTQGEPAELTLTIHNSAEYAMRDITVSLELSSDTIPIAPLGTTSEAKIRIIQPGESTDVSFNLIALPDATSNVYKVPLKIKYYDEIGNNYTKDDLVGLVVDGQPEIHAEVKSNGIYSRFGTGEITLNFVNKGLAKVKFLTVKLGPSKEKIAILGKEFDEYLVLSEEEIYLGDIDPDDDDSADFTLKAMTFDKKLNLPVTIEYRDANNKQHTETLEVELDIHSKKQLGLESSQWWKFILPLILLALFIFEYRHWKKTSKEKGLFNYLKFLFGKLRRKND